MRDLTPEFIELIRFTSSNLSADVQKTLEAARDREEKDSAAQSALIAILDNVDLSRRNSTPICQDTGTPIFYVHYPEGWSTHRCLERPRDHSDATDIAVGIPARSHAATGELDQSVRMM